MGSSALTSSKHSVRRHRHAGAGRTMRKAARETADKTVRVATTAAAREIVTTTARRRMDRKVVLRLRNKRRAPLVVLSRGPADFFERRNALPRFVNADHAQRFHSFADGLIFDHRCRGALDDQPPDRFRDRQHFDDGRAAQIAAAFAAVAAGAVEKSGVVDLRCRASRAVSGSGVNSSRQFGQMRRTRRCAQVSRIEDEIRNGSMPMSSRRVIAPAASFVCKVESTWWPVSAAFTAMSAVSLSRISPIITMSGSCRRMERSAFAKLRPMSLSRPPG